MVNEETEKKTMTTTWNAIAEHLKIGVSLIESIEEWASVLFVRLKNGSPKFVSKKVKVQEANMKAELKESEKQVVMKEAVKNYLLSTIFENKKIDEEIRERIETMSTSILEIYDRYYFDREIRLSFGLPDCHKRLACQLQVVLISEIFSPYPNIFRKIFEMRKKLIASLILLLKGS